MNREQKNVEIEEITAEIQGAEAIFVVDYRGMTVPQAAELRGKLREADTSLRVVKNTLTRRAADAAGSEDIKEFLVGPTAVAFVRGDAALAAKALAAAQKEHEILDFKGGTMSGRAVSIDEIKALSKLPSRDALIGQLVGLTASPIGGIVRTLGGFVGGLASQLGQIRDQGLVGGTEAAAPAVEEAPAEEPAAEDSPAEEAAADQAPAGEAGDGEAAAEAEAEEAPAADEAPEETASADDAAEEGDESADNDDDGDGSQEADAE